ncbi:PQQ-binding-like beta-propeller repeat protein [Actinoplanes sp. G11-F43]|uniref:outer membrane protein assembly factor BamB family protein n=1 Tax=Actinoplanes sp. G11-F43 TaxID=3424130 RepID=UPI003D34A936
MPFVRRTTAIVLSLALAGTAPASATTAALWDHPGYDAEDSHFNPLETGITGLTIGRITQKWHVPLRTSTRSCSTFGGPVLAAGRVHVSDQLGVSAYDAATGKTLWRYDWDDPADNETPTLALSDGLLIVAGGDCNSQSDPDGRLLALDARTGLPRWKLRLDNPVHSIVVDKHVIVVSGGSPSDEDLVAAFAVTDGRALWTRKNALTSEVAANGTIVVRLPDGTVALSVTDGTELWKRSGSWTAQAASPRSEYFYATDKSGKLSAIRVVDGHSVWTAAAPSASSPTFSSASLSASLSAGSRIAADWQRIYRVDGKTVEALNTGDGRRAWSITQTEPGTQPVRAGGLLYAGGPVLSPDDGTPLGQSWPGTVTVAGGRIHQVDDGVLRTWAP